MEKELRGLLIALIPASIFVLSGLYLFSRLGVNNRTEELRKQIRSEQTAFAIPKKGVTLGLTSSDKHNAYQKENDKPLSSSIIYCLPFRRGNTYKISQGSDGETHAGENQHAVDFEMPVGTPIVAIREGTVVSVTDNSDERGLTEEVLKKANSVLIRHADGSIAIYAHLRQGGAMVKPRQAVKIGAIVGYSGNTGFSSGPHLHLVVQRPTGHSFQSLPIMFNTDQGILKLVKDQRVTAPVVCSGTESL